MSTQAGEKKPGVVGIGWRVYQQIAAVIGSFALLAFLGGLFDLDWHGLLASVLGAWDEYVRPPVRWLLHYVIEVPAGWLGWDMEVPLWLRDYLAVGLTLAASQLRVATGRTGLSNAMKGGLDSYTVPITMIRETGNKTVMHTVESKGLPLWETALLFPAALVWAIRRFAFFARPTAITLRDRRRERLSMVLFVSPVLYAGVLLGLNYLVL